MYEQGARHRIDGALRLTTQQYPTAVLAEAGRTALPGTGTWPFIQETTAAAPADTIGRAVQQYWVFRDKTR